MASDEFQLDGRRSARLGLDEAIFCGGKTLAQITAIFARLAETSARALFTRLDADRFERLPGPLRDKLDFDPSSRTAILGACEAQRGSPRIAIVTAGTSDIAVAREASRTLAYYGLAAHEVNDVGVAGLWRLTERLDELRDKAVVIVVAGMDAALVSVVGGLVPGAVIAVPTSVGYGVAAGGTSALHAALASCAPGVLTVNIDNGYGAACAAVRILRATQKGE